MKAVVLAGGSGTRLWPLSRESKPKQFHALLSSSTLLQETLQRLSFLPTRDIFIATTEMYLPIVKRQIKNIAQENIIVEPTLRDTANCIGLAATVIEKKTSPDEVMCVIYADHYIKDSKEFEKKLRFANKIAAQNEIIAIIEVKAKYANPNLGYVKIGRMLKNTPEGDVYALERFIEKPDLINAQTMIESYKYLWNTGLYVWKVKTILKQFQKHIPHTFQQLQKMKAALGTKKEKEVLKKEYSKCKKISIDYAIMEKIDPKLVRIIPADLGWSDIGTWEAIYKELTRRKSDNMTKGDHISLDTRGSVIYNYGDQLIATIGIQDLIIASTKDAILICAKNRSQEVKQLVEQLKKGRKQKFV